MTEQPLLPGFGDEPHPTPRHQPPARPDGDDIDSRAARLRALEQRVHALGCSSEGGRRTVFGSGPLDAPLMIIGEAPSARDEETGHFFSGPAGRLLRATLAEVGLDAQQIWFTNTVKCRPVAQVDGRLKNRPPTPSELRRWEAVLAEEIDIVQPRRLLCLGAVAARAVIRPDFKIGIERGTWHETRFGHPALATYLAAFVLRKEGADYDQALATLRGDLTEVRRAIEQEG